MIYNYHTHTYRCGHATGKEEEYIKRAIECGMKYMGFADHAPYICSNGEEVGFRVPVSQAYDYVSDLRDLREKYKDKIEISIGFEMEYYPEFFEGMLENAKKYGAEYLILGQHYTQEELPDGIHTITETDSAAALKKYVSCVISAMKSGVFTYVAHPDMFNFIGDKSLYREEMRKICVASREYDIPLEINFLGIRENRCYPCEDFWQIAGEEKSPVTFGLDAHTAMSAFDGESLPIAETLVKKYRLNYIGKPKLRLLEIYHEDGKPVFR